MNRTLQQLHKHTWKRRIEIQHYLRKLKAEGKPPLSLIEKFKEWWEGKDWLEVGK